MTTHKFRGGLRELLIVGGRRYAITNHGVLKFTGGRWRDAVLSESDLRRQIKTKEN